MSLNDLRKERQSKWLSWKDIAPLRKKLDALPKIEGNFTFDGNIPSFECKNLDLATQKLIYDTAFAMRPWRKGPFEICETFIDSEWQSFLKYNLLLPYFDLKDKVVGDIGCNNGYYLFKMFEQNPKTLVGFDPSPLCKTQFDFINHFAKTPIVFELLGVEHLPLYEYRFDTLFCLGVLYHRSDPVSTLKSLAKGLKKGGELFLDTFMIDGEDALCLCPGKTYSKIPNIYHIPTVKALQNWGEKAGFLDMQVLECVYTTPEEQRKTSWIKGESLSDFLSLEDSTKTIEGYPAPKRLYVKFLR